MKMRTTRSAVLFTALSVGLFGASLFAGAGSLVFVEGQLGLHHGFGLAAWSVVWGVLGCTGVLIAGRIAFGRWLAVPRGGIGLAAIGIALAALVENLLYAWSVARYGRFEPDFIGESTLLFATLVALAVAGLALRVAPAAALAAARIAMLAAAAATVLIVAFNLPGLADGIGADSWPLAIAIGCAGLYALGVVALALRRLRRGEGGQPPVQSARTR